jgi:nicotinate phosphoribosyltransferase
LAFRPIGNSNDRPLLVQLVNGGKIVGDESTMRERHLRARAELPLAALKMSQVSQ